MSIAIGIFIGVVLSAVALLIVEYIDAKHNYDLKTQRIIMNREFANWLLTNDRDLYRKYINEMRN